jgi:hypothetical protein
MIKGIIIGVIVALFLVSVAVEVVVPFTSFWDFWTTIADAVIPATVGTIVPVGGSSRTRTFGRNL